MAVGHMACHVSTCMAHEKDINMVWELFIEGGRSKKEKEGKGKKGKKERKRKEREEEKKGREKERVKESGVPTVGTRQTKK